MDRIELPIYIDNNKLFDFKVKDYNLNLEELRESLNDIVPEDNVFYNSSGPISTEDEEYTKVSDILIDGAIHFKTQDSICREASLQAITTRSINIKSNIGELIDSNNNNSGDGNGDGIQIIKSISCSDIPDFIGEGNGGGILSGPVIIPVTRSLDDAQMINNYEDNQDDGANKKKRNWLKNINIEENRKSIIDYCSNLPMKFAVNCETFQDTNEIVEWDLKNSIMFPPQETTSFITKSTFNSSEHNAHKGGLYSWNGTLALKSIFSFVNKGQIENEKSNIKDSKTVYSYTHGMVSRLEIRIEPEYIKLKDGFIKSLEEASKDLNVLKEFLKNNEFFPTRYVLGGKISSTGHKKDCTEQDKESFGFSLENRFKYSFHDPIDLDFGFNINNNNSSSNTITGSYSFDEKRVCGGNSAVKDDFDKYVMSLESINDCSIIEIGNLTPIWNILKNQNKLLYDKCIYLLNSEEKTIDIQVYSKVETNNCKGYSKFIINGKELDCGDNKGFNVVLLDSNGLNLDSKSFNTSSFFFFVNSSKKFARYLTSIKDGIILLSVNGDGFSRLSDAAKNVLVGLGIERVEFLEYNSSFCAIIKKGAKKNVVVQNSKDSSIAYCEMKTIVNKN